MYNIYITYQSFTDKKIKKGELTSLPNIFDFYYILYENLHEHVIPFQGLFIQETFRFNVIRIQFSSFQTQAGLFEKHIPLFCEDRL